MNALNPWLILLIAILLEVAGTLCLKLSNGMARLLPVSGAAVLPPGHHRRGPAARQVGANGLA